MADGDITLLQTSEDPARARVERHQVRLEALADHGLRITAVLAARAEQAGAPNTEVDVEAVARAYNRVSRAVRLAAALSSKLAEEGERQDARRSAKAETAQLRAAQAALHQAAVLQAREDDAKDRAWRVIRRAIRAQNTDIDHIERLDTESADRLDDLDTAILMRPTAEIVAMICKDLGLSSEETPYLPREAAGGGPPAEERGVEGAGLRLDLPSSPLPNSS